MDQILPLAPSLRPMHGQPIERRRALLRLALAWLAMMQVMMLAWPGYVSRDGLAAGTRATLEWAVGLMNWTSLCLTVPVLLYSAWPLWINAASGVRRRRISMDEPIALGLLVAFVPSAYATIQGQGKVYFDSITMFIAFVLTARYLASAASPLADPACSRRATRRLGRVLILRANRQAARFMLLQLGLTLVAAIAWFHLDPSRVAGVTVAMLVLSCPCAMAISVPAMIAAAQAAPVHDTGADRHVMRTLRAMVSRAAMRALNGSVVFHAIMIPIAAMGDMAPWVAALTMLASSLGVAACAWLLWLRLQRAAALASPVRDTVAP